MMFNKFLTALTL